MTPLAARTRSLASLAAIALGLAGCAGLGPTGGETIATTGQQPGLMRGLTTGIFGNVQPTAPANVDPSRPLPPNCPRVDVREGTETLRTFDAGGTNDVNRLRWQATIAQTARECASSQTDATYRVGVAGRVVLGPTGTGGQLTLPVRVAVVRGDNEVITSRLIRLPVQVGAGEGSVQFSTVVDDIRVPRAEGDLMRNVQIIVGFDPAPERPQRQTRRQRQAQR